MDKKVKQVQIAQDLHRRLKLEAAEQGLTMQALLEQIFKDHFDGDEEDNGRDKGTGGTDDNGDGKRRG